MDVSSNKLTGKNSVEEVIRDTTRNWIIGFIGDLYEENDITSELYVFHNGLVTANDNKPLAITINMIAKKL